MHVCIGGVFCATDVDIRAPATEEGEESHVMITCLSRDLRLLTAVVLNFDPHQQKSALYLRVVSN